MSRVSALGGITSSPLWYASIRVSATFGIIVAVRVGTVRREWRVTVG